jgi:hypothetical protein
MDRLGEKGMTLKEWVPMGRLIEKNLPIKMRNVACTSMRRAEEEKLVYEPDHP